MKIANILTVLSLGLSQLTTQAFANTNDKIKTGISDITAAREQTEYLFNQPIANEYKERLRYVNDRLNNAEYVLRQALNNNPNPPPPIENIEMYKSDSCSGDLVGAINPTTKCSRFTGAPNVWGIKVNGKCQDIQDTSAVNACELYKNINNPQAVKVYRSDSCSSSLSAIISSYSDCDALPKSGNDAWAIMLDDKCLNISDTTLAKSCVAFKAVNSRTAVRFYKSDSCSDDLIAAADELTDCTTLSGLSTAWAVQINGKCQDITDTPIVEACNRFKP